MMRSKILVLAFFIISATVLAQSVTPTFEGEIVYKNTFKSKMSTMKDRQFASIFGTVHNYFIKGGDYKVTSNGMFAQGQLYINNENRIYNKMASSDTLFWNDASENYDKPLDVKVNKNADTILGYICDEILMKSSFGTQKFYFNSKFRLDGKLFENHRSGYYSDYMRIANAVPLRMVIEERDFIIDSEATEIKAKKLDEKTFSIPADTKTAKSIY